jgi:hypothetical protein
LLAEFVPVAPVQALRTPQRDVLDPTTAPKQVIDDRRDRDAPVG